MALLLAASASAQAPAAAHAQHHPDSATATAMPTVTPKGSPQAPSAGTRMGAGMGAGMEDMMKQMGAPAPTELYPALMNLPELSAEARADVVRRARAQMEAGTAQLSAAMASMSSAAARDDFAAMQQATRQVREATALYESGLAAHRALEEGRPPRDLALRWFRREMSLASTARPGGRRTFLGVAPLHLFTMVLLVTFALAMIALYYAKMRRAAALFGRIGPGTPPAPGTPPPSTPPGGKPPAAPPVPSAPDAARPAATPAAAAAPTVVPAGPVAANWRGELRVVTVVAETPSVKTVRLVPATGGVELPFTFVPGQFLNVTFWIGGAKMNRSYSISSSPTERTHVELTVRREPRGAVSRHIVDLTRAGDTVEAGGPVGRFTFTGAEADSIVLISGGVGITPMMSITRWLTEQSWAGDIFFLHSCRSPADFIFAADLAALERRNPKLHVAVVMEQAEGTSWTGARGRITGDWLAGTVPDLTSRRVHLCGPPMMMDAVKAILTELGVSPDQVKTELFGTPKPAPAPPGSPAAVPAPATGPLVTFSKHGKSAKSRADQTLLELSEELDIAIEFSCRVGTCGVCKVTKTSGEVTMAVQDALDPDDIAKGVILACQAKPVTDVTVAA